MKDQYVCGFLFNDLAYSCVLVRKLKPKFQAGLLNGVGGKVELGESALEAMVREFTEETGVNTSLEIWDLFAQGQNSDLIVHFFSAVDQEAWFHARTVEAEEIIKQSINPLPTDCMSNLQWLIPLALCPEPLHGPVQFEWTGTADMERKDTKRD
jgi:8-oxo-dGTP diphosphatase